MSQPGLFAEVTNGILRESKSGLTCLPAKTTGRTLSRSTWASFQLREQTHRKGSKTADRSLRTPVDDDVQNFRNRAASVRVRIALASQTGTKQIAITPLRMQSHTASGLMFASRSISDGVETVKWTKTTALLALLIFLFSTGQVWAHNPAAVRIADGFSLGLYVNASGELNSFGYRLLGLLNDHWSDDRRPGSEADSIGDDKGRTSASCRPLRGSAV